MNDANQNILDAIKVSVWGGFDTFDQAQEVITDLLEEGADEKMLRESVETEFKLKADAEKSWPQTTDVDQLNSSFRALKKVGILCLHNAGYTMSDGHDDAVAAISEYPKDTFIGYCFYHGQDLERVLSSGGLLLAYDHIRGDVEEKIHVAKIVQREMEAVGFRVEWDGTPDQRINLPDFDWKHRTKPD